MKPIRKFCALALLLAAGGTASVSQADVFYSGQTKGQRGAFVELTVNARAGTTLESIDIVPDLDPVADVLQFTGLDVLPALTDGGSGPCAGQACALFYIETKTFPAQALLARICFRIADDAPIGPVAFDPGITVGEDILVLPAAAGFEVLAIPEPGTWGLGVAGLFTLWAVLARRRASESPVARR